MGKKRLGKGLTALISDNDVEDSSQKQGEVKEVYLEQIEPNPFQPRQEFDEEGINELANSIKENGVIQPITLRQVKPDLYQLVAGERRWRASRKAGLKQIPAIIQEYNDQQMMEIALIENLQREDLNPIEEAQAYQKMMDDFDMTQEEVAKVVGKSRSSVANTVRLLNLPLKIQVYVSRETLSMGHARALLSLKETELQLKAAEHVIENKYSVRKTEKYIQKLLNRDTDKEEKEKNELKKTSLEPEWKAAQNLLSKHLDTKVKIKNRKKKKLITIECNDLSQLENILKKLNAS